MHFKPSLQAQPDGRCLCTVCLSDCYTKITVWQLHTKAQQPYSSVPAGMVSVAASRQQDTSNLPAFLIEYVESGHSIGLQATFGLCSL